ncbi:hypothetical protein FHX06_002307 [Rhizobium sp. BK512]|uniref:phosphodiester glycosidase family protein n=1 Tax=Rhizobium sp. BK512 TaxID=2587010 RepID=UPI000DDF9BF3|nr:phosphodiester glycosidase family protein [Rhizobium sp. BK512]MBB3560980.1 hypothetical protein [Rhizobium sp. BK512]
MSLRGRIFIAVIAAVSIVVMGGSAWLWDRSGAYGFNVILRRGGTYWISVKANDPRLSPAMQLSLTNPEPVATAGQVIWREVGKGFEVAELPVMVGGHEIDTILLNRIDPRLYRFVARNASAGDRGIDEWEKAVPQAVLIVNGSYYDHKGEPDTPILSDGVPMGPADYDAKAGAFVSGEGFADIKGLSAQSWQTAFQGATNAMVSYPLLLGADGQTHVPVKSRWLANRTFVAKDNDGRVIIGTTKEAFFSLTGLADFLKDSPLNLKVALNFDGGPIACQSVRLTGFQRKFYARWEAQVEGDEVRLLRWPLGSASWAMPMVLTVERRTDG